MEDAVVVLIAEAASKQWWKNYRQPGPIEEVFRPFTDPAKLRFTRTCTTVRLSSLGSALISRSEARWVVQRLSEFEQAVLDFSGVDVVGQGFCDEVFRIFARHHPEMKLEPVGMNDAVAFMIARAKASGSGGTR